MGRKVQEIKPESWCGCCGPVCATCKVFIAVYYSFYNTAHIHKFPCSQGSIQCHAYTNMKAFNQLQPFSQLGTHHLFDTWFDISYEKMLVVKLVTVTYVIRNVVQYMETTYNTMKWNLMVCEHCSLENLYSGHWRLFEVACTLVVLCCKYGCASIMT